MKLINTSNIEAYHRYVLVYSGMGECAYCKKTKQILSVDTSDDEYHRFDCCLDCFTGLITSAEAHND
jgi:hypothetical protein